MVSFESVGMVFCRIICIYIVCVVSYAGDFKNVRVDGIDQGTGDHVDFIVVRNGDKGILLFYSVFLKIVQVVSVNCKNIAVKLAFYVFNSLFVVVDDRYCVFFVEQSFCQLNTGKSCSNNHYVHLFQLYKFFTI